MKLVSIFLLTLCIVLFLNVEESLAKKRSEAFKRCLKQMKTSFKQCLLKLTGRSGPPQKTNETIEVFPPSTNGTSSEKRTVQDEITTRNYPSAEERYELIQQLQSTLMEKIKQVPPGKMKLEVLEKFKEQLSRIVRTFPEMANRSDEEPMSKLYSSLIETLKKELREQDELERMHDPKFRKKVEERRERQQLEEQMKKMQETLSIDLEKRSKLQFTDKVSNRIRVQVTNTSSLKEELTMSMVDLTESRDTLEEIKRTCRQVKKIYETDVSATIDVTNYLLQNVDLKIDLMTSVVRIMNYQPNLLSGSFGFDFTRVYFDQNVLQKASAEIYEMTRSFAEMRELHYKIKDGEWSALANKTGLLFFRMNNELLKQREKLLMPPS